MTLETEKPDKLKILLEIHGLLSMHKITQFELARHLGVSVVSVNNWLKSEPVTTYDNLYAMIDAAREIITEKAQ